MTDKTKSTLAALLTVTALAAAPACKFPYPADVDDGDAGAACEPSTTTCTGNTLTICDADGDATNTTCAFGCFSSGDRCADLAPSNGLAQYLDQARVADAIHVTGTAQIDTDSAQLITMTSTPLTSVVLVRQPVDLLVLMTSSLEADNVIVTGTRALAIVSDGDVRLHGTLSVSARSSEFALGGRGPGAGALTDTSSTCSARMGMFDTQSHAGAGGGGFGSAGGRGGKGNTMPGGLPGEAMGNQVLTPLHGGCPGARGWGVQDDPDAARAGQGGGALQISTRGRIKLLGTAAITSNGSGPGTFLRSCPFVSTDPAACDAGSGGGAGGALLLEASGLDLDTTAAIVANGGSGSCSYRSGGADGSIAESPAPAPDCSSISGSGTAGRGSAGSTAATDGGDGSVSGGGGGGGVGRIRINLPAGVAFDPGAPVVSPAPSMGLAATR